MNNTFTFFIVMFLILKTEADVNLCSPVVITPKDPICNDSTPTFEVNSSMLINAWKHLSWKRVSIWASNDKLVDIVKESNNKSIMISSLSCLMENFTITGYITIFGNFQRLAYLLNQRRLLANSIMITLQSDQMPDFRYIEHFKQLKETRGFYVLLQKSSSLYHVMLSPNATHFAANELSLATNTSKKPQLDFKGIPFRSIALDWIPYIRLIECNDEQKKCQAKGLLIDLLQIWSEMYNFTHEITMQADGKWGTVPVNGTIWNDCEGTFVGLFGTMTKGQFDLGLSSWDTNLNRQIYVDMTSGLLSKFDIEAQRPDMAICHSNH